MNPMQQEPIWGGVQNAAEPVGLASLPLVQRPAPQAAPAGPQDDWNSGIAYNVSAMPQNFNWQDYIKYNPDLGTAGIDTQAEAARHYDMYGRKENRRLQDSFGVDDWGTGLAAPTAAPQGFDWQKYILQNRDLAAAGIDTQAEALKHYATYGQKEGRTVPGMPAQQSTQPAAPQQPNPQYKAPVVAWTPDTPPPKAADGREFMVWGGDKNIGGKKFYIDPTAYDNVRTQIAAQREALVKDPQGKNFWRAGEKGEQTPDWVLDDMAKNLVASGVTDIRQIGKSAAKVPVEGKFQLGEDGVPYTMASGVDGDEVKVPRKLKEGEELQENPDGTVTILQTKDAIINKQTGEPIISQYGGRTDASKGIWGGTYQGSGNTGYRVMFDEKTGLPIFGTSGASSKDGVFRELAKAGPLLTLAGFIPGLQFLTPIGRTMSGISALAYDNPLGAVASLAGAVPGFNTAFDLGLSPSQLATASTVGQGAGFVNAAQNKDLLGMVSSGAGALGSANTAFDLGFGKDTLGTIGKFGNGANIAKAVQSGNYADAALGAAGMAGIETIPGTNISVADAAKYVKLPQLLEAAKQGNPLAIARIVQTMSDADAPKKAGGGLIAGDMPDKVEAARILRDLPPAQARMLSGIAATI